MRRRVSPGASSAPGAARARPYACWSKQDLHKRAREIGIEGRSSMSKAQLIDALRNH
jgi:hypothetical protein